MVDNDYLSIRVIKWYLYNTLCAETFEDIKCLIRNYNDKRTNNDLQNTTQKTKDWATRILQKTEGESLDTFLKNWLFLLVKGAHSIVSGVTCMPCILRMCFIRKKFVSSTNFSKEKMYLLKTHLNSNCADSIHSHIFLCISMETLHISPFRTSFMALLHRSKSHW
jgi:hypothetical protein